MMVVVVANKTWGWPWIISLLTSGEYVFAMTFVQLKTMRLAGRIWD
jgi:hypothetical protein